jgi:hypothetical protein
MERVELASDAIVLVKSEDDRMRRVEIVTADDKRAVLFATQSECLDLAKALVPGLSKLLGKARDLIDAHDSSVVPGLLVSELEEALQEVGDV